jgi:hypothetical protein
MEVIGDEHPAPYQDVVSNDNPIAATYMAIIVNGNVPPY